MNMNENDPIADWLEDWSDWLDALLATGLALPSTETRQRIRSWCEDAEALGFLSQATVARQLIDGATTMSARVQAFLDLTLEQDMLRRLLEAQQLSWQAAEGDGVESY